MKTSTKKTSLTRGLGELAGTLGKLTFITAVVLGIQKGLSLLNRTRLKTIQS